MAQLEQKEDMRRMDTTCGWLAVENVSVIVEGLTGKHGLIQRGLTPLTARNTSRSVIWRSRRGYSGVIRYEDRQKLQLLLPYITYICKTVT